MAEDKKVLESSAQEFKKLVDNGDIKGLGNYFKEEVSKHGYYTLAAVLYNNAYSASVKGGKYSAAIANAVGDPNFVAYDRWGNMSTGLLLTLRAYKKNKEADAKQGHIQPQESSPSPVSRGAGAVLGGIVGAVFGSAMLFAGTLVAGVTRGLLLTRLLVKKITDSTLPPIIKYPLAVVCGIVGTALSYGAAIVAAYLSLIVGFFVGGYNGIKAGLKGGISNAFQGVSDTLDMPSTFTHKNDKILEYRLSSSFDDRIGFFVKLREDPDRIGIMAATRFDIRNDPKLLKEFDVAMTQCSSPDTIQAINEAFSELCAKQGETDSYGVLQPLLPSQPESEAKNEVMGGSTIVMHDGLHPNQPQEEKEKELQHTQADLNAVDEKVGEEKGASSSVDNVAATDAAAANEDEGDAEEEDEDENSNEP